MVKCIFCQKTGRKLERCTFCKRAFHSKCGKIHKVNVEDNCCSLTECQVNKMRKSDKICHRCGSLVAYDRYKSCSSCDKSFCSRCLRYRYKTEMSEIGLDWECFICNKTCACKDCRREATDAKSKKFLDTLPSESHVCHQCNKRINAGKYSFCDKCKNLLCYLCTDVYYKNLENCPICLDICTCTACGDSRFNKDFPGFNKGVDLRTLYPYDLENIFYINGFWVRSINL